jgi:hypothetical protein
MRTFRALALLVLAGGAWSTPVFAQESPAAGGAAPVLAAPVLEVAGEPADASSRRPEGRGPAERGAGEKGDKEAGAPKRQLTFSVMGVQFAKTDAPGYANPGLSGTLYTQSKLFGGEGDFTEYNSARFIIGGGSAGFEGAVDWVATGGWGLRLSKEQMLFGRVGFQAWIWGNRHLYSSLLSLPEGQIGWQLRRGNSAVELGVHGGLVVVGRYHPGLEDSRKLGGSADLGAYGAIHLDPVHVDVDFVRVDSLADQPGARVDSLRGSLCLNPGSLALCLRGDWLHGSTSAASSRAVDSFYTGLVVGVLGP